jgi:NAD(P)-dependent dehydrogenase (short-subunit alcohol dehydrogenase family)
MAVGLWVHCARALSASRWGDDVGTKKEYIVSDALKDRVVVVTGAASGIGAAAVEVLAKAGVRIAALDLKWPKDVAGPTAGRLSVTLDVTNEAASEAAFAQVMKHFGRIDGLATCAGIVDTTAFLEIDAARFRKVTDVNVLGTFLSMKAAGARMAPGGRIVTIASIAGLRGGGLLGTAAYAASKGAVLALTKNAARTFGPMGIAVNSIAPGATDTPMTAALKSHPERANSLKAMVPLGRLAEPAEIAEAIAWLLSPQASYINGATLVVDGGIVMM